MRVLVLGGDGMLGHKVFETLQARYETYATFRSAAGAWTRYPTYAGVDPSRLITGVDALNFTSVVRAVGQAKPDVTINCIGIIKQLKQAHDAYLCIALNALFPHQLADLVTATDGRLLHISTDCVFTGRKGNYTETDVADAEDLYGRTKLLGEVDRPNCLTIRTSIIGRDWAKTDALLEWFLSQQGGTVRGYTRAIYTGFPTQTLARIMGDLIDQHPQLAGVYQLASAPISKYDLLVKLREALRLEINIEPQSEFFCDRSLNAARFVAATGYVIPTWDAMLAEIACDPTPYDEWKRSHAASHR